MEVYYKLPGFLTSFMALALSVDAVCIAGKTGKINEYHPSNTNDWHDIEQWNSSAIEAFCPAAEGGTPNIECADDNGEPMGSSKHTRTYTASCILANGLICRRSNLTNGKCPDFSVRYTCTCPLTTTTVSLGTNSSSGKPFTSTALAGIALGAKSTAGVPKKPTTGVKSMTEITTTPLTGAKATIGRLQTSSTRTGVGRHISDTGTIGTAGIVGLAIGVVVFISLVGAGLLVYFNISKKKRKNKIDTILRA